VFHTTWQKFIATNLISFSLSHSLTHSIYLSLPHFFHSFILLLLLFLFYYLKRFTILLFYETLIDDVILIRVHFLSVSFSASFAPTSKVRDHQKIENCWFFLLLMHSLSRRFLFFFSHGCCLRWSNLLDHNVL
jgi:hypothetical protein